MNEKNRLGLNTTFQRSLTWEITRRGNRMKKTPKKQHSCRFILCSLTSETSLSFGKDGDMSFTIPVSHPSKGRSKSNIFREGDYNMMTQNTEGCFTTTQKRDFAEPQAAGVSTVTHRPYSHVLPKYVSPMAKEVNVTPALHCTTECRQSVL